MALQLLDKTLEKFDERYYRVKIPKTTFDHFSASLKVYKKKIDLGISNNENEEYFKREINDFLQDNFYPDRSIYDINTNKSVDSSIRVYGVNNVLIEVKKTTNIQEMVCKDNINKKALWELTYYFLKETRNTDSKKITRNTNSELKNLIITDALTWMIIDATELDKICDGYLEKLFWKYENNKLTYAKNTSKFYEDIKDYFDKINVSNKLVYTFFDIRKFKSKEDRYLYKILSKEFLLKEGYNVESKTNVLNNNFYHELLYIMGLKEAKDENNKNKTVIEIDSSIKNSLANQVYNIYVDDKGYNDIYHSKKEATEKTFELIIIWINRLLFIKLFEGQLISFNSNDYAYKILDNTKIKSFSDLQKLFFNVLGKKERNDDQFYNQFSEIPYLNSSLFEQQDIEREDINIKEIRNEKVNRASKSSLGKHAPKEIPLLEYIINFLNSYDFSAQGTDDENRTKNREIIDASVLGLIFEKLNGYKDGSVYTPSIITEYMCKQTIEKTVIDKINSHYKWKCNDLDEVKFNITSLSTAKEINSIINTIKICDPAVGSGHFLVSALNRIIAIKAQLGVLFKYESNDRLNEVDVFVLDDVLCVRYGQDQDFVYDKNNNLSQQIQETLFNEKRIIIEEMLFGVDINPKAVHICQLRLWIELLKNAYYKHGVMETLPNIDINIKAGNSLVSSIKFEIGKSMSTDDEELKKSLKKSIKEYKNCVKKYKYTSDKLEKVRLRTSISALKSNIRANYSQLSIFEDRTSKLNRYEGAFEWAFEIPEVLDENGKFIGFDVIIGNPPYIQLQKMKDESEKLEFQGYSTYTKTGDIYCLFYERGNQLLKKNGILSFITSNKWMRAAYGEKLRRYLADFTNPTILIDFAGSQIFDNVTVETNILTFEKSPNKHNTLSCAVKEKSLNNLSVYVEQNSIATKYSNSESWNILSSIDQSIKLKIETLGTPLKNWNISINYGIKTGFNDAFIIDTNKRNELISQDPKSAEIIRPILRGRDIKRYSYKFADKWIILAGFGSHEYLQEKYPAVYNHLFSYEKQLKNRGQCRYTSSGKVNSQKPYPGQHHWLELDNNPSKEYLDDFSKQKIVWGNLCLSAQYTLVEENMYISAPSPIITNASKYVLALLNSRLLDWYVRLLGVTRNGGYFEYKPMFVEKIPIPHINKYDEKPYEELVNKILERKETSDNTSEYERMIDEMVFDLYGLNQEERKHILSH